MLRAMAGAGLTLFISHLAFAQVLARQPAFDVTSGKPYRAGTRQGETELGCSPNGRFTSVGLPIAPTVRWAYITGPYQIRLQSQVVGLPDWADGRNGLYEIEGRVEAPVTEAQCRRMAQSLLADRFKLAVHIETRSFPVSALVVAKGGPKPKLRKAVDSDSDTGVFVNGAAMVGSSPKGWSMGELALFLSVAASMGGGGVVSDRTGLDGLYRFSLDFAVGKGVNVADETAAALQDQLGLKIETKNEQVEVVVVDHIEKPDEN
jgi:uncharacterized protein (TIGR03435 family)